MPVVDGSRFHGASVVVTNNVFCRSYLQVILIHIKELTVADRHRLANHTASVILPENLILLTSLTPIHILNFFKKSKGFDYCCATATLSVSSVVPESLRWLILKGRTDRARHLVTKMATFNRIAFPKDLWETVRTEAEESARSSGQQYHFLHLFRTPRLRRRSIILFYIW